MANIERAWAEVKPKSRGKRKANASSAQATPRAMRSRAAAKISELETPKQPNYDHLPARAQQLMWSCDEGRRPCWSSSVGMGSGWMAVTCLAHKDEAGGAQGQVPLRWLGARASTEWRGSTRRERPMSSHMAGGCPPRSAVASGPLKCELKFSAGSCAFGLFVTSRFGESERASGPGATPLLASSFMRIGSELFRAGGWAVGRGPSGRLLG